MGDESIDDMFGSDCWRFFFVSEWLILLFSCQNEECVLNSRAWFCGGLLATLIGMFVAWPRSKSLKSLGIFKSFSDFSFSAILYVGFSMIFYDLLQFCL